MKLLAMTVDVQDMTHDNIAISDAVINAAWFICAVRATVHDSRDARYAGFPAAALTPRSN